MKRICPNPMAWDEAFKRLTKYAESHPCTPPSPPTPLILAGWAYSNDVEKKGRWEETVTWATANGCQEVVGNIADGDFYYAADPTTYIVGPLGGPMYRPWDFEGKEHPSSEETAKHLESLVARWSEIVGPELARITRPLAFTGEKGRRLLVRASGKACPPWGGWSHLSANELERRTFTRFRAAINSAIAPHEVDHVDFIIENHAEQPLPRDAPMASCS